jgi:predicted phosphodiesterase
VSQSYSSPVRVAVLSDIHGNLLALEAALARVRELAPDIVLFAGDIVVGSPDSRACWEMALSQNAPLIRGNHERYVTQVDLPIPPPELALERFAPVRWAAQQFTQEERQQLGALPLIHRHPDLPDILFCHGSPRSDNDIIVAHTPEERLAAMLDGIEEPVIVRAHTHVAQTRTWQGKMIVTAGSVGLPLDHFPTAQFLLLERRGNRWETLHQSVEYDVQGAAQRFITTGYLDAVGPVARLFQREVLTASYHWVPFLKAYFRWSPDNSLPLSTAIERFLSTDAI